MRARRPANLPARSLSCPPITDRNRRAVLRFQRTMSDARPHLCLRRPSARFQPAHVPFRSASSLPVAPFPSPRASRSGRFRRFAQRNLDVSVLEIFTVF